MPIFYIMNKVNLYDTLPAVILPTAAFSMPISTIIMIGRMRDITADMYEAMALDGASSWRTFRNLVLPLSRGGIATILIFSALNAWNGFLFPLILTQSAGVQVFTLGLYDFNDRQLQSTRLPMCAAVVLSIIPILLVYLFARRWLIRGLMGAEVSNVRLKRTQRRISRWNDTALTPDQRIDALIGAMTLREKLAQLYAVWVGVSPVGGDDVAPFQHELTEGVDFERVIPDGLGQLTRPFGSAPVDPAVGVLSLARMQRRIVEASRFGIPALAHEECLAGFTAWGATAYPVPLSWGASFNPELIEEMANRIGTSMRSVGIHQGLAPVLDVARDPRWGRVEETISEDPYLVGTIASAYVRGLEGTGIIATLKHFIGYSASKAGRNLAPVSMGPREFADVMALPFEMAVRESGVRSVMSAYTDVDGIPAAANRELLTGLLRETWGFEGTVVADYFGVTFLRTLHGVAGTDGEAAVAALTAGVDVELPTVSAYGEPLAAEVEAGRIDIEVIDTALRRVLRQKLELGLLDPDWDPLPEGFTDADLDDVESVRGRITLDTDEDRALARRVAEESVVLLTNDGTLPLDGRRRQADPRRRPDRR